MEHDFTLDEQAQAVCAQTDPDAFYAEKGDWMSTRMAKRVCAACPVRERCLEVALARGESGVWGGTTEHQRRKMIRQQRAAVAA